MNAINRAPTYAVRQYTVPAGGVVETIRDASFVTCLSASADFRLSFDNAPEVDFEAGLTYRTLEGFQRVAIRNPGAAQLTVKLGFGRGDIKDARVVISASAGALTTREESPDQFNTLAPKSCADAAVTALVGNNALRRELVLTNEGAGTVYITGNGGAVAGQGIPLAAGATLVLQTSDAVFARNDSGAPVTVQVSELGYSA